MGDALDRAILFAAEVHKGQRRKGAGRLPYIVHPIHVLEKLVDAGVDDEDVLVAAVLHDTVEDSESPEHTMVKIADDFGERVLDIVVELSFMPGLPHGAARKEAKTKYLAGFKDKSIESRVVKLADRIDNLESQPTDPVAYAMDAKVLLDATSAAAKHPLYEALVSLHLDLWYLVVDTNYIHEHGGWTALGVL